MRHRERAGLVGGDRDHEMSLCSRHRPSARPTPASSVVSTLAAAASGWPVPSASTETMSAGRRPFRGAPRRRPAGSPRRTPAPARSAGVAPRNRAVVTISPASTGPGPPDRPRHSRRRSTRTAARRPAAVRRARRPPSASTRAARRGPPRPSRLRDPPAGAGGRSPSPTPATATSATATSCTAWDRRQRRRRETGPHRGRPHRVRPHGGSPLSVAARRSRQPDRAAAGVGRRATPIRRPRPSRTPLMSAARTAG